MTAKNQNFEMFAGDTKSVVVTVTDSGTPVNLAGATIKWAVKRLGGAANELPKQTGSGITITDVIGGKFTISLLPADTASLAGDYYHEAEVTDSAGNVSTVLTGRLVIMPSNV